MSQTPSTDANVNLISTVPVGKIRCYVKPDVLREDTPEEHVRQRVARSLVEEYGYRKGDMEIEFPIKIGSGKPKRIDIAIFRPDSKHIQDNVFIVVEAKTEDVRPSGKKNGIEQMKSYLSACLNSKWGLWVGSELHAIEKTGESGDKEFVDSVDIPLKGDTEPRRLQFDDLVPATDGLRAVFSRCHNYLHVNANIGKEKAFFELLKLIFCKVYDEQETSGDMQFSIAQDEKKSDLGQRKLKSRIVRIFNGVKGRYPYIFPASSETIDLDNRSLAYVVGELQKFNFQETSSDIKGEAYEEIVSVTSRRDQGAFFTPRNLCDLAVGFVLSTYSPEQRLKLKIIDPACGTGGFLRSALVSLRDVIFQQANNKWKNNKVKAQIDTDDRLRRLCAENIFGIDKLPELVSASQMNLAMHGDGSTNVFHANSLLPPGEWPKDSRNNARQNIVLGTFDVVIANPPFGSKLPIDDPHILEQFDLSRYEAASPRTSMPPEQLFIERCLQLLKPGGRMALVLPDSILSNPGLAFIRRWLLNNAYIIASIDLPREMFAKSDTHTMTSVLIIQKFTQKEKEFAAKSNKLPDYEIFMAVAERVGWDLRGKPIYMRDEEGEEIFNKVIDLEYGENLPDESVSPRSHSSLPIIDDQLPAIEKQFKDWLALGIKGWQNG